MRSAGAEPISSGARPRRPDFLDQVVTRKLRVGDSEFHIMLHRYGADVSVNLLERRGDGRVVITL